MNTESQAPLPIGELARRSGVAASALRFYEQQGLMSSRRSAGGRREYARADLRRVAFIRAAQAVGLSLDEIRAALATLPDGRTLTQADWQRLSRSWQPVLEQRIAAMTRLRDQLASCIGCGCLSLKACALYNPEDAAATRGSGPRYLLGDKWIEVTSVQYRPAVPKGLSAPSGGSERSERGGFTSGSRARAAAPPAPPSRARRHPGRT